MRACMRAGGRASPTVFHAAPRQAGMTWSPHDMLDLHRAAKQGTVHHDSGSVFLCHWVFLLGL